MKMILTIARREHQAYFSTPVGWMCLCGFIALTGFFFAAMTGEFAIAATRTAMNPFQENTADLNSWLIQPFFANTAVVLLMLCPALTMRLLAEDRKQGSLELLLSSPISSAQIVLGKYLGAMSFLGSCWRLLCRSQRFCTGSAVPIMASCWDATWPPS